ncbi:Slp family lipoprotein [Nitrospira sp. M1]
MSAYPSVLTQRYIRNILALSLCGFLSACSSTPHSIVPKSLQGQVDHNLSFAQIKESPDSHVGKLVLVGGEILSAKRLKDHTRLTILQLPLTDDQEPTSNRTESEGRLLAFQSEFLDPATVPAGTRVTLIGKITGSQTEPLDEMDYVYPTMNIQHIKVWEESEQGGYGNRPYYGYPFGGPYWGYYGGLYRPYPYWYWW